mgnify:CR=1 FL=1
MSQELAEGIFFLPGRRGGRYPYCNSLYIQDERSALFDPACDPKELKALAQVDLILLSHFHSDHIRELRLFPEVEIAIHEREAEAMKNVQALVELIFFPDEDPREKESWIQRKKREMHTSEWGFKVQHLLKDGQLLSLGKYEIQILHTPGHTIGHCCFWIKPENILFSADIDFTEFGPWYGNACSSAEDFFLSLEKIKSLQPKLVITAHEQGIIPGEEFPARIQDFQRIFLEREEKILEFLAQPRTLEQIVEQGFIYGEFLKKSPSLRPPERRMIIHHLNWLEKKGMIKKEKELWQRT